MVDTPRDAAAYERYWLHGYVCRGAGLYKYDAAPDSTMSMREIHIHRPLGCMFSLVQPVRERNCYWVVNMLGLYHVDSSYCTVGEYWPHSNLDTAIVFAVMKLSQTE